MMRKKNIHKVYPDNIGTRIFVKTIITQPYRFVSEKRSPVSIRKIQLGLNSGW